MVWFSKRFRSLTPHRSIAPTQLDAVDRDSRLLIDGRRSAIHAQSHSSCGAARTARWRVGRAHQMWADLDRLAARASRVRPSLVCMQRDHLTLARFRSLPGCRACVCCSWDHTRTLTLTLPRAESATQNLDAYPYPAPTPVPLPHVRCVVLNAVAGLLYSMSLIGLDPNMPDPTLK